MQNALNPQYQPVPVAEAKRIAEEYSKAQVVIIAIDATHRVTHHTSYGMAAKDKIVAAQLSDLINVALTRGEKLATFEDFRDLPIAEAKERIDRLERALRGLQKALPICEANNIPEVQIAFQAASQVLNEKAAEVMDYDPNPRMGLQTVRLTFALWEWRAEMTVSVGGNCRGEDVIRAAVRSAYDDLPTEKSMGFDIPFLKMVRASDGAELVTSDDEDEGSDFLAALLIRAEILSLGKEAA